MLHFSQAKGLKALGVALENDNGVVVDNFSVRGNSGLALERLDSVRCRQFNQIRPYDMIILQYGLNVANDSVMQYGWYGKRMEAVAHHIKRCFPTADILILGVSDRSTQENGTVSYNAFRFILALYPTPDGKAERFAFLEHLRGDGRI